MRFSDIPWQRETARRMCELADSDRIPHAILLSGPEGTGKLSLARAFAAYIHCEHRHDGDACGTCPSCLQHRSLNNPDLHYVFPVVKRKAQKKVASDDYSDEWREFMTGDSFFPLERWMEIIDAGNSQPMIYVEESAEILKKMSLTNYVSRYKVILVWLPERMNLAAANKLLKALEEPQDDTVFILVSDNPSEIIPTILSRTRRIPVDRPEEAPAVAYLSEACGVEMESASEAFRLSAGNMDRAADLIRGSEERKEAESLFMDAMRSAFSRRIPELKNISEIMAAMGREKTRRTLDYFGRMLRENYIRNLNVPELNLMSASEQQFSSKFSPFIHSGNIEALTAETERASADILRNANAKIVLFDLMMKYLLNIKKTKNI